MANETTPLEENPKPNTKSNVPLADLDFGKVATNIAEKWTTTPVITLLWTTAAAFSADAVAYNKELLKRMQVGSTRPQITQVLSELDNQIEDGLSYVKGYITEKYKKESAASYYPAFRIIHNVLKGNYPDTYKAELRAWGF